MPTLFAPFRGIRPTTDKAAEIIAPPYDVLNSAEAAEMAAGNPNSFLHVSKAEIDLPDGTDIYSPEVYQKAAENFARLINDGLLIQDETPCYYVYRLTMGTHVQTGIVAAADVGAYDENRIRKHEFTRPAKEDDRVRQIDAVNAQTGPVLLAYPAHDEVKAILANATTKDPVLDAVGAHDVRHQLWVIDETDACDSLTALFDAMPAVYIADGHHRSAAASRVAAARNAGADDASRRFLTVSFPADEMLILDYNRVVKDLNGLTPEGFIDAIKDAFDVSPLPKATAPTATLEMSLYLDGSWYKLTPKEAAPTDPVARLDVSILSDRLLGPVLNIQDLRKDTRIDFVGGMRGLKELEKRVDSGEMAAAFAMFATKMDDLFAVADSGNVMPPKSTWFEPKLADGVTSHGL